MAEDNRLAYGPGLLDARLAALDVRVVALEAAQPDDILTTRGDIIYRNATVAARLAVGASGRVLGSNGTDPAWVLLTPQSLATLADDADGGGIPIDFAIALPGGANGNVEVTPNVKCEIIDFTARLDAAGTTGADLILGKGASAISDTIDISSGADKALFHPTTMDNANAVLNGSTDTLRATYTSAGGDAPAGLLVVRAILRA